MANPTTNYGWVLPTPTDLVTDLPADFDVALQGVDTTTKALNPSTTLGDIEYRSATANTNTRLGIGTNGQLLSVSAGVPAWQTVSTGGMTLISTTTLTGASVTLSSIPATFNDLRIIVRNARPATDGTFYFMRVNGDSGANRYRFSLQYSDAGADNITFDGTRWEVEGRGTDNTVSTGLQDYTIPDYANATTWKMIYGQSVSVNATTTTNFNHQTYRSYYNQTGAISSLSLTPGSGNWTSGTVLLYGVK